MRLVIDRRIWMRGGASRLLCYPDGSRQQCCVGIYLTTLGVSDLQISEKCYASELKHRLFDSAKWLRDGARKDSNSELAEKLYDANDGSNGDAILTESQREQKIADLFGKVGVDVEFIN